MSAPCPHSLRRIQGILVLVTMIAALLGGTLPALAQEETGPTIASDKQDYAPAELVTLSGENWQSGEAVHIRVNDDQGESWRRDVDVTADETGNIRDQFHLPGWFVAVYTVTATGAVSGTATTTFTDGNLQTTVSPSSTTVTAGGSSESFTITSEVQGSTGSGWKFKVNTVYTISGGVCAGSGPVEYAPAAQGGGGSQTFVTPAGVSAASGQAAGTFSCLVQEIISQSGSNPALAAGSDTTLSVTVSTANAVPAIAADAGSVTEDEGQTATNTGTWNDSNGSDTVTLSASIGTVTKTTTGPGNSGTWSWSLDTTDGPAQSQTVTITVDDGIASATTTFELQVDNVAPTADLGNGGPVNEGSTGTISFSAQFDPSAADTTAGFIYSYDFDNDGTFEVAGSSSDSATVPASYLDDGPGSRTVRGRIEDKDGGFTDYTTTITIDNVAPSISSFTGPTNAITASNVTFTGSASDPSTVDTAAGFGWRFTVPPAAFGAYGSPVSTPADFTTSFSTCGSYTVEAQAIDKDGGESAVASTGVAVWDANFMPPLVEGRDNLVQKGRVVPVQIRFGCGGHLSGLSPEIQLLKGVAAGAETGSDNVVTESVSNADTGNTMREVDSKYLYNLAIPTSINGIALKSGDRLTIRVRPFGPGTSPSMYIVLEVRK